jgi:hypothetical protein
MACVKKQQEEEEHGHGTQRSDPPFFTPMCSQQPHDGTRYPEWYNSDGHGGDHSAKAWEKKLASAAVV